MQALHMYADFPFTSFRAGGAQARVAPVSFADRLDAQLNRAHAPQKLSCGCPEINIEAYFEWILLQMMISSGSANGSDFLPPALFAALYELH